MSVAKPESIRLINRRHMVFGATALATAGLSLVLQPRSANAKLTTDMLKRAIPPRFGRWAPVPDANFILPPEDEGKDGVYDNLLMRAYSDGLTVIMLLVAYTGGQAGQLVVHRPEACYPANGFAMSPRRIVTVAPPAAIPAIFYTATAYDRTEQLLYWTRVGHDFPLNWAQEQIALVRTNLGGQRPDGVLVRISTLSGDADQAAAALTDFADALAIGALPAGRKLLFNIGA